MECNKEEAMRAKDIAEKKMQSRDFSGARKIALKAQQLFPDLVNISRMLSVCDVHCSAAVKINGSENWYGILQVEPTADESSIKKQYQKLVLLLQPGKNKFAGAEAAFKLIREAHRTLSDPTKRSFYDLNIRSSFRTAMPKQQPNRAFWTHSNMQFTGLNQQSRAQQQQTQVGAQTFWTQCSFCKMKYQYYRSVLNKALHCQSCQHPFIVHEISLQSIPAGANSGSSWNQSSIPQQHKFPGLGVFNAGWQSNSGNSSCGTVFLGNVGGGPTVSDSSKRSMDVELCGGLKNKGKGEKKADKETGKVHEVKFEKVKLNESKGKEQVVKSTASPSRKRGIKMALESSENDDGDFGSSPKRLRNGGSSRDTDSRDSAFSGGDANEVRISANKNDKKEDRSNVSTSLEENLPTRNEQAEESKGNLEVNLPNGASSKADPTVSTPNTKDYCYLDSEFCDFGKDRNASKFEVSQIWALYDDLDGMPRSYALIRNISSPDFMLQFTWLENDPVSKDEKDWSDVDLPIACGKFRVGRSQKIQDLPMFSHVMCCRQGAKRNVYEIYPRTDEVWAIFKGWDISWSSNPFNHRQYEYEIVEVLTDYANDIGVSVIHLVRVKGFVSLFCRTVNEGVVPVQIEPNKMLMFSHMVPAYKLTGEEREGVPKGSYELDTGSLPPNFQESFPSLNLDDICVRAAEKDVKTHGQWSEFVTVEERPANEGVTSKILKKSRELNEENIQSELHVTSRNLAKGVNGALDRNCNESSTSQSATVDAEKNAGVERLAPKCQVDKDDSLPASSDPMVYEYPDPEFCSFESERSCQSFQTGQIWALYCDIDGFPKYYAVINKVDLANFKVHLTWLEACPELEEEIQWSEENLPISCGRFKVQYGRNSIKVYETTETFSHLVLTEATDTKRRYNIYPHVGEVWALYKNWNVGWKLSNMKNCEYDLVEVIVNADSVVKVIVLTKVDGFKAVFRPERKAGIEVAVEITQKELLKFSHQIPAFRLTEERNGKLRGCWELDVASVPEVFLCTSSWESHLKNAGVERMAPNCHADKNDEVFGSPDSSSSRYAEHHDDSLPASADLMVYEYPDSEFYSFESERSHQSFQTGQIWALYCDLDGFPKYYGVINKVGLANFKVHVTWLEACPGLEEEIQWSEEDLPISCGRFKVQSGRKSMQVYETTETFSHLVLAEATEKKQHYDIYPHVGEVWAVYRNWNVGWKSSNLENCEYDMVEIIVNADSVIKVIVLTKEAGFKAVFRPGRKTGIEVMMEISRKELLKFSHQIPAFRLTEERGGELRGCWELDTASVPEVFLFTSS